MIDVLRAAATVTAPTLAGAWFGGEDPLARDGGPQDRHHEAITRLALAPAAPQRLTATA